MIAHFTRIIYLDYRGFDYCGIFRGNNNRDNRGIPAHSKLFSLSSHWRKRDAAVTRHLLLLLLLLLLLTASSWWRRTFGHTRSNNDLIKGHIYTSSSWNRLNRLSFGAYAINSELRKHAKLRHGAACEHEEVITKLTRFEITRFSLE
jgi:hypothetical protein